MRSMNTQARLLRLLGLCILLSLSAFATGCGGAGNGEGVGTSGSAVSVSASEQAAYQYFVGKGLTSFQAAGIVGNLQQEAGVDPTSTQYGGGPGRGVAQWSAGGRWDADGNDNAVWYAQTTAQSVWTLSLQLDFVWYELETFSGYGLAPLRGTTNVTNATIVFETDFEGCGTCDQSSRIAYAEAVLAAYGSSSGSSGTGGGADCSGSARGGAALASLA